MLTLAHLGTILAFVLIGGLGMAAMQDGLTTIWRHLVAPKGVANDVQAAEPRRQPRRTGDSHVPARVRWARPSLH
ncbi:MAG: hypothetical protein EP335_13870 [Alphaproteobacteria bacterium]|nr:MAG: hypothetical protein EP335_13870 [Alphaproteobacteria bacterium]